MAQPNVGYGAFTSSATLNTLSGLIAEFAPERFVQTVNNKAPIVGSGVLAQVDQDGEELVVAVDTGTSVSAGYIRDFGVRPGGQTTTPSKARFAPASVTATLSLGKNAALAKVSDKGLSELVDAKLKGISNDVARVVGRGVYLGAVSPAAVATWSGTAANSTVTIDFTDASLFKIGAGYDFVDTSANTSFTVRCTAITPKAVGAFSANVAAAVSFMNDVASAAGVVTALTATAVATDDIFSLRGNYAGQGGSGVALEGARLNSFDDIAGAGAALALGGLTPSTTPGWQGTTRAAGAAYSQEAANQFAALLEQTSGEAFTDAIMSPQMAEAHRIMSGVQGPVFGMTMQPTGQRVGDLAGNYDKFGAMSGLSLRGRPVLVDLNCPASMLVLHNREECKLGVWSKMEVEPVQPGSAVFIDQTQFAVKSFFSGSYQMYTANRSAIGVMTGHTGL